jgi:hypothetical protein
MKGEGNNITQGHLDNSTLVELRDDLINNWDIHYSNPNYQPCWWSCGQKEQQADLQETFHSSSITQELGGYL